MIVTLVVSMGSAAVVSLVLHYVLGRRLPTGAVQGPGARDRPAIQPVDPDIYAIARDIAIDCGCDAQHIALVGEKFDLLKTGKFDDVLHHAAYRLGFEVRTLGDAVRLLKSLS